MNTKRLLRIYKYICYIEIRIHVFADLIDDSLIDSYFVVHERVILQFSAMR